jgi:hypothetical protein
MDTDPMGRNFRLILAIQSAVKLAILAILAVVIHYQAIPKPGANLVNSVLGLALGWEAAVIYYRLVTVWRG